MIHIDIIAFFSLWALYGWSSLLNNPHLPSKQYEFLFFTTNSYTILMCAYVVFIIITGLPPAAPKSDFSLKKKIAFLVFKRHRWDIVIFLTIPFAPFLDIFSYKWVFFLDTYLILVALWLFRIMNFERYLNEK